MNKMFFAGVFALALVGLTSCTRVERCPDASAVKASSFGWNAEDATECLQKALDSGVPRLVVDRQAGDWIVRPLALKGKVDMEVVFEDGVILRAKRGEYKEPGDVMLTVTGCTNLTLRAEGRASFVMRKADYRDGTKYKTAEWRHTLAVYGGAHVRIADLTFADSGGDGIYVHSVRDIRLDNVVSRGHYRQGLSIICVDGFLARHCLFTETRGAAPQCGVDIEPNNWYEKLSDIVFEDCAFTSNAMAGVSFYVPSRRAKSPAFGVTLRNCRAEGNVQSGFWNVMNGKEPVKGALTLENCVSVGNGGSPFHLQNACATNGIVVRAKGCTFDARGGAHAVAAVYLPSATAWHDFGNVDFSDCTALVDRMPAISFVGRPGIGLTGATGRLAVDRNGEKSVLDVAAFAKGYPPRPELLKPFRPATLDLSKLRPVADKSSGGENGTWFRWSCDFVQHVPKAGEYAIRFRQTRLTPGSAYSWKFTVTDETGKTVETFDLTKQDETYVFKAPRSGVYRFKGRNGHSTLNVVSDHPGWGLFAVKGVELFKGRNHRFFFRMPAGAKEIEIQLSPQEKGSAQLVSPEGKVVVDVPVQAIGSIIRHTRADVSKAETWELRLPFLAEDYGFAIGGDAVPVASMGSPDNVLEVAGKTAAGGSVRASSFGWNAEDATECLQKAINSGAGEIVVDKMPSPWIVRPIKGVSNQRIVFELGVEVVAKKGEFKGVGSCLFSWTRCSNVTLSGKGAILRMRKADYLKPPYRHSEWRMGLSFADCSNVTIEGLEIRDSGGDGIYLSGGRTGGCRNVTIRDVVSDGNNRQGISVISCDGLTIENSVFRNTAGAPPEAGIDFEPNEPGQFLRNVVVRNCRFENNVGRGIEFALPHFGPMTEPISVLVEDCVTVGNKHGFRFASNSPQHWDEVTGTATFRRCDFLDAVKDPLTITKKKDGGVTLAFESCRVRAAGDPSPRALTDEALRSVIKSATFLGGPFEAGPVEPDYAQYEPVDAHPGELLPLPVAYERFNCRFVFYADRARTVRFKGRAGAVGPRGKPPTDALVVEDLRGRKVGELPMPGAAETEISCAVPAAGFYRISSRLGVYGIFALTAADAPVAIDIGSRACLVRPHGRFYFGVEDERAPTEIGFSAREEAKVGVSIADPDGKVVHADRKLCGSYYLALERPRRTGLWSIDYAHGRAECSFSMKGAPSWLFFSKDRCWRRK